MISGSMDEQCLVICGEWRRCEGSRWKFSVDNTRMSRVVAIREGMSIVDLQAAVLREFFGGGCVGISASLSYWPPNSGELATGLTTPPVLVTNGGGVLFFLKHFRVERTMNLFASFGVEAGCSVDALTDGGGNGFATPLCMKKSVSLYKESDGLFVLAKVGATDVEGNGLATPLCTRKIVPLYEEGAGSDASLEVGAISGHVVVSTTPAPSQKRKWEHWGGGKSLGKGLCYDDESGTPSDLDEEEILREVVEAEGKFADGRCLTKLVVSSQVMEEVDYEDYCGVLADGCDVRPVGYDTEFWEPLIEDSLAGSDAVDIMFPAAEGFDGKAAAMGMRREYRCLSSAASDSVTVTVGNLRDKGCGVSASREGRDDADGRSSVDGSVNDSVSGCDGQSISRQLSNERWTISGDGQCKPKPQSLENKCRALPGSSAVSGQATMDGLCLDVIDDEEFDIPPLFDDTLFVTDDIPDLDIDGVDEGIHVGKLFNSKEECRIALAIYAIKGLFTFRQSRTRRHYFVMSCTDDRCHWRVMAREVGGCGYYEIKRAELEHTCCIDTRNAYKKKASSRVIAAVFKAKYGDPDNGPRAAQLQQLVLEDLRVKASYMQCYRAIGKAVGELRGSDFDSYANLPMHLPLLKKANPGTVADLEIDTDGDGIHRFLYVFLAFGASITGFRKLRPVIVLDGTHLWGKYKGVLMTACGQDANFQVYPLAFAVVDGENEASWTWFLLKLERILAYSPILTIVSDRHRVIYKALKVAYPKARHGCCVVHLARNVASKFHNKGLGKLVIAASKAYRVSAFKLVFDKIRASNGSVAKYLEDIGMAHWTRVYCRGQRFNIMTNNACEQLNNALKKGRGSPIVELLRFIQEMMTRWFNARRKKLLKNLGNLPPEVDKLMTTHMKEVKGSKIKDITDWSCQVVGMFGEKNQVSLADKTCSCKKYNMLKIPCGHALLAADSLGLVYSSLVGVEHRVSTWQESYAGVINPVEDAADEEIPEELRKVVLFPPRSRKASGRRKEIRYPSAGEIPVTRVKKLVPNKCSKCLQSGHNRSSCKI